MEDSVITVTDGSPVSLNQVYASGNFFIMVFCYCRILSVSVLSPQCLRILVVLVSVLSLQ